MYTFTIPLLILINTSNTRFHSTLTFFKQCLVFPASQNSLYITTKLAEVPVEKVNGSLGVTIRGGLPDNSAPSADLVLNSRSLDALPLVVTHVRPGGAAYNTSRIKPGDRLLKVDHVSKQ